ncbi:MAG: tetratricopeptide repeat protein [Myxococcota bacterium]
MAQKMKRLGQMAALLLSVLPPSWSWAELPYPAYRPYQAEVYGRRGLECLQRQGPVAACQKLLETAVTFDPSAGTLQLVLGQLLVQQKDYGGALSRFVQAQRAQPEQVEVLLLMAQLYMLDGKPAAAKEKLDEYLQIRPQAPEGFYELASLSAQQGELKKGLELLEQAQRHGWRHAEQLLRDLRWQRYLLDPALQEILGTLPGSTASAPPQ